MDAARNPLPLRASTIVNGSIGSLLVVLGADFLPRGFWNEVKLPLLYAPGYYVGIYPISLIMLGGALIVLDKKAGWASILVLWFLAGVFDLSLESPFYSHMLATDAFIPLQVAQLASGMLLYWPVRVWFRLDRRLLWVLGAYLFALATYAFWSVPTYHLYELALLCYASLYVRKRELPAKALQPGLQPSADEDRDLHGEDRRHDPRGQRILPVEDAP